MKVVAEDEFGLTTEGDVLSFTTKGDDKITIDSPASDCQPGESGLRKTYLPVHTRCSKSNKRPMGIRSVVHAGIHESLRSVFS